VPERVLGVGLLPGQAGADSSIVWFPVSATEWNASASIEDAPVTRNPANLATAMPRLARRAATAAVMPAPEAELSEGAAFSAMCPSFPSTDQTKLRYRGLESGYPSS
jgi:hypothetical protein